MSSKAIVYFKITSRSYHGLCEYDKQFNKTKSGCYNGIEFAKSNHIHNMYMQGNIIQHVYLPTDDPTFATKKSPLRDSMLANKILFGDSYPLNDPATYKLLGINMISIYLASVNGYTNVLDWYATYKKKLLKETKLDDIFAHSHVESMQWWLDFYHSNDMIMDYTEHPIDMASENGRIDQLQW